MRTGARCAASPGERAIRAGAGILVAAFAVSVGENLWYAIPAGLCAVFLAISAITGWCHTGHSVACRTTDQRATLDTAEARPTVTSGQH